jgi:hypothetical protein
MSTNMESLADCANHCNFDVTGPNSGAVSGRPRANGQQTKSDSRTRRLARYATLVVLGVEDHVCFPYRSFPSIFVVLADCYAVPHRWIGPGQNTQAEALAHSFTGDCGRCVALVGSVVVLRHHERFRVRRRCLHHGCGHEFLYHPNLPALREDHLPASSVAARILP